MNMENVTLAIGIIFVVVYSYERFNDPGTNRSSTTAARYHLAALAYTLSYLCIFYVLSRYPALIKHLFVGGDSQLLAQFNNLPSALLVALLLTGFLQKIPVLSQVDHWLRDRLQYLAAIPFEVRRLAKQLCSAEFRIDEKVQNEVYKRLRDEGLVCNDINFEDRTESYWLWNKASVLMYHLSQWGEQRKTSAYMSAKLTEYKQIKTRYNRLSEMAKSCLKMSAELKDDSLENRAYIELTKTFQEECRNLIRRQCEFISHGALKCVLTNQSRGAVLKAMGFELPDKDEEIRLTVNQMATLLVALVGGMLTVMILFGSSFGSNSRSLYIIMLVVTMNMVAVATVVYTKGKWSISNRDAKGNRPVFYYLLIALTAVVISMPVTLFFKTIIGMAAMNQEFTAALVYGIDSFFDKSYPWKLMIFATSLCLAYQLDTTKIGKYEYSTMRWFEGALQAGVALVAAYVTYNWIIQIDPEKLGKLDMNSLLFRSALIGFVIGYTIPYWYKVSPKQLDKDVDEGLEVYDTTESVVQKA